MADCEAQCPYTSDVYTYVDVATAMKEIVSKFETWYYNRQFDMYLGQVSATMARQIALAAKLPLPIHSVPLKKIKLRNEEGRFDIDRIFVADPPTIARETASRHVDHALSPPSEPEVLTNDRTVSSQNASVKLCLRDLCAKLQTLAQSKCEQNYIDELRGSCIALETLKISNPAVSNPQLSGKMVTIFRSYLQACGDHLETMNIALAQAISGNESPSDGTGPHLQHSPRISSTFWLSQLHRDRFNRLTPPWKTTMIDYGLAITHLHQAQRLVAISSKPNDLLEELGHVGHSNWDPWEFPKPFYSRPRVPS